MKQGTKANKSGLKLEALVEDVILKHADVDVEYYSRTDQREDILLKHVPYTNIYGNERCRSEFVLCMDGREIRVECKTQKAAGSVDEKLPYVYLNFTRSIPEDEAIIILEGDGFKEGAKEWMRKKCRGTKVRVFSFDEFKEYVEQGFRPKTRYAKFGEVVRSWLV
tara:strand:+ start:639 stop:1133 length:495 start_codon:yes stop_codon:yes gene_type:complete